ncbi:MAG: 4Fe-4S binding protein [Thermomicrobium sp.]
MGFEATSCIACGQCVSVCPEQTRGAIRVQRVISWEQLSAGPQVMAQDRWTRCLRCGASIAPARMLDRVMALLATESSSLHENLTTYCFSCRLLAGDSTERSEHDT